MRRGAGVRGVAALAAVLGMSLLCCASALAKMTQTITFTSTPPSPAAAGESYEVSARSSSGLPVELLPSDGCSTGGFQEVWSLAKLGDVNARPPEPGTSPMSLHFLTAGPCAIEASAPSNSEYEAAMAAQIFTIAKDPSEEITFLSAPAREPDRRRLLCPCRALLRGHPGFVLNYDDIRLSHRAKRNRAR